jgi:tRNA-2-methylthio-N6-dimethylallyladenosine synthase
MRRSYRSDRYLGIIERVRAAMPDAAITTDIIVGFPGETDDDHRATLDVVRAARFASAFTFQYSPRPGTPAATMPDQVPAEVVKARYAELATLVDEIAWEENKKLVGRTVELMVAEGEGRKDGETLRLSGRAPDNRLVHFVPASSAHGGATVSDGVSASDGTSTRDRVSASDGTSARDDGSARDGASVPGGSTGTGMPRPGDLVTVEITYAAPHHLVSDLPATGLRRTRSGDAWEARQSTDSCTPGAASTVTGPEGRATPVLLGLPTLRP